MSGKSQVTDFAVIIENGVDLANPYLLRNAKLKPVWGDR
jgi:hypothetical protein